MRSRWISIPLLALLLAILAGEAAFLYWEDRQPKEKPCDPIIVAVARDTGIDPFLIRALIWRESKFDPMTHGTAADERGLMQVTPMVGEMWAKANKISDFKPDDLYDPNLNIRVGTWYLSRALHHWNTTSDPTPFALAEYNAGRSNALKWVDPAAPTDPAAFVQRISFPGTRKYVEDIMTRRDEYKQTLVDNPWYKEFFPAQSSMSSAP